jgi:hypothetical protein
MVLAGSGFVLKYDARKAIVETQEMLAAPPKKTKRMRIRIKTLFRTKIPNALLQKLLPAPTEPLVLKGTVSSGKGGQATKEQFTAPKHDDNCYDSTASDSEDEGGFLDRDLEGKSNKSSTSYPIASAQRCHVSKYLSSLANRHLQKMRIALKNEDEAECCADSGATNHLFSDYDLRVLP